MTEVTTLRRCTSMFIIITMVFVLCVMQAMKVVSDRQMLEATEKQMKETELSRVKINKEDIDLIVSS